MSALEVKFSDTVIARYLKDETISQLRDPRYPLRLRFNKARTRGSWFVVSYKDGKTIWKKIANYPAQTFKDLTPKLADICSAANDGKESATIGEWETVDGLLKWYGARVSTNRGITKERKATIASAIKCHLMPRLADVPIADLNHAVIDNKLMWPMQAEYSLSHVESVWRILKTAMAQALKLRLIDSNPLASLQRSHFIAGVIAPKGAALRSDSLYELFESLKEQPPMIKMLILMMLAHGTRIGETRKAKWSHFDLADRSWFIPAENTKTRVDHRLPLTDLTVQLLADHRTYQEEIGYQGVYLFPYGNKKPASAVIASEWVRNVSGRKWSAHDLRKLARTAWADLGIDYMVGEMLLNHALSKMDKTYIHTYAERQIKNALEIYHGWLIECGISALLSETVPRFDKNAESLQASNDVLSSDILTSVIGEDIK